MQVYIYNGAEAQLNLPDTLRIRTEQRFAHWSSSLLASVTTDAIGECKQCLLKCACVVCIVLPVQLSVH